MKLYLVRHGDAIDPRTHPERPLSETGISEVESLGQHLESVGLVVPTILHSEYLRAKQTAERLAAHLGTTELRLHPKLAPGDPVAPVLEVVRHFEEDTMLVGHLPFMAHFASELLVRDSSRLDSIFNTATVMCIGIENGNAWLNWMLTPGILARKH